MGLDVWLLGIGAGLVSLVLGILLRSMKEELEAVKLEHKVLHGRINERPTDRQVKHYIDMHEEVDMAEHKYVEKSLGNLEKRIESLDEYIRSKLG